MKSQHNTLLTLLGLKHAPIAISFCEAPPEGVSHIDTKGPASCAYWKLAEEGNVFYTNAADHDSCPIGAYTHNIDLSKETQKELEEMLETMVGLSYLKMEDVPDIPRRKKPFSIAVYAPLLQSPLTPDIVLIRGDSRQMMLLVEASQAADIPTGTLSARPTCQILPSALEGAKTAVSFGCIGNRVYTGLADNEAFCAIPGTALEGLIQKLEQICHANQKLKEFHQNRLST